MFVLFFWESKIDISDASHEVWGISVVSYDIIWQSGEIKAAKLHKDLKKVLSEVRLMCNHLKPETVENNEMKPCPIQI